MTFAPGPIASGRLRPLAEGEALTLTTVFAELEPYRTLGFGPAGLAGYLGRDDPALIRFVIETNGLDGVIALRWPWLRGPFVEMLSLVPAAQGQGLGRAVIAWAAEQAATVSANLWATVSDFNAPARAFYARQGFVEVAALPGLIDPDRAEILLRRRLS